MNIAPLQISAQLNEEFATVAALWDTNARTRTVDCLILSWVKYEKQLRRLFTHLVCGHQTFTEDQVGDIIDEIVQHNRLYGKHFIKGLAELGHPVSELVGNAHDGMQAKLSDIEKFRNKIFHGQITGHSLDREALEKAVATIIEWMEALATGAADAIGYDGLSSSAAKRKGAHGHGHDLPFKTPDEFRKWFEALAPRR